MTPRRREPAQGLDTADESIGGRHGPIPIRRYRSLSGHNSDLEPLVWLHGGAFSHGGLDQLESHAVACCLAQNGREVVTVGYRLVPPWSWIREPKPGKLAGIRYPIPLEDVLDAVTSVMDDAPRHAVALGGASAGACLAAAATLRLRDEGREGPTRLILAYGTFHAALPAISPGVRSRVRRHGFTQFRSQTVEKMNWNYAGSLEAMGDHYAFPGGTDLTGFPPTLVLDAYLDILRASGEAFACELHRAGVPVEHAVVPSSRHGFLNRPGTKSFDVGIEKLELWLQRTESSGSTEQ